MTEFVHGGIAGRDDAAPDLGDADRVLRGLAPEVRSVAHYLLVRTDRPVDTPSTELPRAASLDVALAAETAVRDAILEATDAGLPASRARTLHGRLDRAFASIASELVGRARTGAQALVRDVSHDLRSPINSILFLADSLASERSGQLNEVQRRQVGVLYTASLSLVAWLTDLIDAVGLVETETIPVRLEKFSAEAVLTQIDQLLQGLAAHSGVELAFRLETMGPRRGDRRILSRILVNLVSNAIQATPNGGRVAVSASERRAGWLTVTVEDTGTEADIEQLRRRLSEAPLITPGSADRGWTHGLGLSICARLVDAVEGELRVDEGDASGCRFTLNVPFDRA